MIKFKKIITPISLVIILSLLFSFNANAQSAGSGQALEIAPPILSLSGDPGQTIVAEVSLRDISTSSLIVSNEINDFTASGEDGTPKILMDEDDVSPFSIKSWIQPISQLKLEPKQIKKVPITIKIPANAPPGGYYGVVRFSGNPPELDNTGVSLSASLGALILLRVNGEVVEKLSIEEFYTSNKGSKTSLFEFAPIDFVQRIKNDGTIHDQPAGQITITDMFNNLVARVNINLPPRDILPGSIRKFEQTLDKTTIGNKFLFGKYTAELKIIYGSEETVINDKLTFWVIPYTLIAIIVIGLIAGFFILRTAIRKYNNHIIEKAQKQRSKR